MTTKSKPSPRLTKERRKDACELFSELKNGRGLPTIVTPREADLLCLEFGLTDTKYSRMRSVTPIRLLDVAVYIIRYKH